VSLSVDNLTIKYKYGDTAIDSISFNVKSLQKLAVLAPTSAGKTSLFKTLAGLLKPASGSVCLSGVNLYDINPKNRNIIAISSDLWIKKHRTLMSTLSEPLKLRGVSQAERRKLVISAAYRFGIYPNLTDLGSQLHDDDALRCAFARSSLRSADLFLIDNVFSILKGDERSKLFNELIPYIKSITAPLVFMTDSPDEAFTIGDNVLILNFGIFQQLDTPEIILKSPATLFVDKYIFPYKTRSVVNINGLSLYYSRSYIESSDDNSFIPSKGLIYKNLTPFAILEGDIMIPISKLPLKTEYSITEDKSSINYFTTNDEKKYTLI
jgi:ABC-type sugar transport system ATPase subunit